MKNDKNKEPLEERLESIIRKRSEESSALKHLLEGLTENSQNESKKNQIKKDKKTNY